jgi:tRNA-splicing endonuclease subunit Sen2
MILTGNPDFTAEQIRERRRAERAQFKLDRAKAIATVTAEAEKVFEEEGRVVTVEENRALIPSAATWKASPSTTTAPASASVPVPGPSSVPDTVIQSQEDPAAMEADDALTKEEEEPLEDLEHLQLTLPEAFFLIWTMDCLTVLHPDTVRPVSTIYVYNEYTYAHNHVHFIPSTNP